jgi:uncharacterized protein YjdB
VADGTSAISATLDGINGSTVLTVTPALESITVTPAGPSVPKGETEQFTATGNYSDGSTANLTSEVTWQSSDTSIASISNASGSSGLANALATGTSTIKATAFGISGTTVLTVSPAALLSIAVTPANPSVAKGLTKQFTATGTYSDNSTQNLTSQVTWASPTTSVATITSAGLATAVATGTSTISATLSGVSGSTVMTATAAVLESIAVTPANPSLMKGATRQFTATGTYSDNSTQNLTSEVTWSSATKSVATITSAGLAAWVSKGTSEISATFDGVSGSTELTALAPAPPPLVTIHSVSLEFNKAHKVTEVLIVFSGAVNTAEAQSSKTYSLTTAGKNGSFTGKTAKVIKIRSASYLAASDTVTLTPNAPFALAKPVQLVIDGKPPLGLKDRFGRFIDGADNGRAGSNGVVILNSTGVTLSAMALARLKPTGAHH